MNSIAVVTNLSTRIRLLKAQHPSMSPLDIAKLMGVPPSHVQGALRRREKDKPKSRIEARGPLSAEDIARKTGMPLAAAKLMVP